MEQIDILLGQLIEQGKELFEAFVGGFFLEFLNQPYSIPTLVAVFTVVCKLFINNKVCALDVKECLIELPCEISVLSVGFAVSYLSISGSGYITGAGSLVFLDLVVLIIDYAIVKHLFDKLGRFNFFNILAILFEYSISILLYFATVYVMIEIR